MDFKCILLSNPAQIQDSFIDNNSRRNMCGVIILKSDRLEYNLIIQTGI